MKGIFRSLETVNYRIWAAGAIISNIGTWMQRTAQDWLVLTELTHRNATAVGIVVALQFGPQLLLLPLTGFAADYFDRRRLLLATQAGMGVLALCLGLLTVSGLAQLWHVYVFAFLLGCVAAFDAPARQSFVSELVGEANLSNAVALNSTEPAMRGRVIAIVLAIALGGTPIGSPIVGWVADHFGPRWALGVGAASGLTAALIGLAYLLKYRNVRLSLSRPYISLDKCEDSPPQSFGRLQREIG